jgi:fructokinase
VAGLLKGLLETPDGFDDEEALQRICRYANAVGALTTTERGAIPSLPEAGAVADLLARTR